MVIREATSHDAFELARIHLAALPDDLLPQLGPDFLRRHVFTGILGLSSASVLVAEDDGSLLGFIIMALDSAALTAAIVRPCSHTLWSIALAACRDWRILPMLAPHFAGTSHSEWNDSITPDAAVSAEIYLLAVSPSAKGRGVGRDLVNTGMAWASGHRRRICLVRTSSPDALAFYQKCGFQIAGREHRGRRRMDILVNPLPAPPT